MINLVWLLIFVFIEGSTMGISKYILETSNKKLLHEAANMGYKLNNSKRIFNTFSLVKKDKILKFLIFIPIINVLTYVYRFYVNTPNNKKIITNLLENKDLIEMNSVEKGYYEKHKRFEDFELIQEGRIIIFPNGSEKIKDIEKEKEDVLDNSKNADVINLYELKKAILNIKIENISENEKNQKIIKLLKDYGIIPDSKKVKKIRKEVRFW